MCLQQEVEWPVRQNLKSTYACSKRETPISSDLPPLAQVLNMTDRILENPILFPKPGAPRYHFQLPESVSSPKPKQGVPETGPPWRMGTGNQGSNLGRADGVRKCPPQSNGFWRACSIWDGRSSEGSTLCSWHFGKLCLNSEGRMSQEGTQAWEFTQPDCCLGTQLLFIYLFSQVHRIEVTILLSSWHNYIIIDPCEVLLVFILFCFVPFISHPWSHPPSHIGTHSRVFNICPSNLPFMCLFTYMCICEKIYGIVMCFNLHKQYCTINLVLFLFSLNILFLRDPAILLYVDLIHSSCHLIHIYHIFLSHVPWRCVSRLLPVLYYKAAMGSFLHFSLRTPHLEERKLRLRVTK